jgi:hypothetical protein
MASITSFSESPSSSDSVNGELDVPAPLKGVMANMGYEGDGDEGWVHSKGRMLKRSLNPY